MGIFNRMISWRSSGEDDASPASRMEGGDVEGSMLTGSASMLEALSTALVIADSTGQILSVNQAALRTFRAAENDIRRQQAGFSTERLVGGRLEQLFPDSARQAVVIDTLRESRQEQFELGERSFSVQLTPVFDESRLRVGTVTEWEDVTDRLKADRKEQERVSNARRVAAENARIRAALDRVTANVMMVDHDNVIVYVNDALVNMLQDAQNDIRRDIPDFHARDLIGKSIDNLYRNGGNHLQSLRNLSESVNGQLEIGGHFFRIFINPVIDGDGKRLGTVVEWKDKTEELKFERYVQQAIDAAIDGNLGVRIDAANQQGFFGHVGKGINQILTSFESVMNETMDVMGSVASGNLTRRIAREYQGSYDKLKRDINSTIERLVEVVSEIRESADKVKAGASEIASGNANLSQRTEEQAASLEETSAAMEQITTTVQQNAANAVQANALARGARETAENGGNVVGKAIAAMQEISDSSKKINDIIGVIDEIAFQTNLLALNAAVEAARAGDQGRGFAVVADEVRNLAGRSATAAKEIKDLIKDSGLKVQEGSELVNQSGETLDEIVTAVKKVNDIVAEISTASDEQSTGLAEINRAVGEMDDMTQQNAALVEEAAAASEALGNQAQMLEALLGFFDTGSRPQTDHFAGNASPAPAQNRPVPERRGPGRPFTGRRPKESAPAPRKAAATRAAPRPKVADDENWTEF